MRASGAGEDCVEAVATLGADELEVRARILQLPVSRLATQRMIDVGEVRIAAPAQRQDSAC